jgi:hypothetical protein
MRPPALREVRNFSQRRINRFDEILCLLTFTPVPARRFAGPAHRSIQTFVIVLCNSSDRSGNICSTRLIYKSGAAQFRLLIAEMVLSATRRRWCVKTIAQSALKDIELLSQFKAVEQMNDDDRSVIK